MVEWRIDTIEDEYFGSYNWFAVLAYKHGSGKHEAYSRERRPRWIQRFGASEMYKVIHITYYPPVPVYPRATVLRLL